MHNIKQQQTREKCHLKSRGSGNSELIDRVFWFSDLLVFRFSGFQFLSFSVFFFFKLLDVICAAAAMLGVFC